MKVNMGYIDRSIRLLVGLALMFSAEMFTVPLSIIMIVVAVIFFLTAVVGFCPLYSLFRTASRKIK